jgi:hypothetical protein
MLSAKLGSYLIQCVILLVNKVYGWPWTECKFEALWGDKGGWWNRKEFLNRLKACWHKHKTQNTNNTNPHTKRTFQREAKTSCANHSPTQSTCSPNPTYLSLPCTLKLSRTWRWSQSLSRCLQPVQSLSSLHFQHLWCEDQMGRCDNIQQCNIQLFSLLLTPTLWNLQSANFLRFWKCFIFRIWSDLIHQMK